MPSDSVSSDLPTLGIIYMWNSVEQPNPNPTITVTAPTDNGDETTDSPIDEGRFELKDIDVIFLPGKCPSSLAQLLVGRLHFSSPSLER